MTPEEHGGGDDPRPTEDEAVAARPPLTQQVGRGVVLVAAMLFLAFVLVNRHPVEVNWLLTATETPLIVVLLVAFGLGALVGRMLLWWRQRGRAGSDAGSP